MESADLRKELECSICLSIFTDPVNLKCGHNFCWGCIDEVLNAQERSGDHFCPQCRKRFKSRPELQRNITLCNLVENFQSTQQNQEKTGTFCSYCVDSSVTAVKSCLHCEAYLCDKHLRVHSKSPEHIIAEPTTSMKNRKCSVHNKILEYYCIDDNSCICVSCCLIGEHKGHQIESLELASEKKKLELKNVWQDLMMIREKSEATVQSLQKRSKKAEEKATAETNQVSALITDLRGQLEDLEKRAPHEIPRMVSQMLLSVSDHINELTIKMDDLSKKMCHIEKLCISTDPLTVLQESEGILCKTEKDEEAKKEMEKKEEEDNDDGGLYETHLHEKADLDLKQISNSFNTFINLISRVSLGIHMQEAADILLDKETATHDLQISDDKKTASRTGYQSYCRNRIQYYQNSQVLSSQIFSLGGHAWEVDVGTSCSWRVGMCYPNVDWRGGSIQIGDNDQSWCLQWDNNEYSAIHGGKAVRLSGNVAINRIRIYLDYDTGFLYFYKLGNIIQHLYTFTDTFTKPLHAALALQGNGCIKIL